MWPNNRNEPMTDTPSVREMERAYLARDGSYDGVFYLAVRSTGIFCTPSCPARKPRPANVVFYATAREALAAGFRPCRRCHPMRSPAAPPEWLAPLMDRVDGDPAVRWSDAAIRALEIDPARVRRHFQKTFGMTFQAYCRARRLGGSLEQIRNGKDLDDVALGHGYESHSGFREAFARAFGGPPGRSRNADCIVTAWVESPLGPMVAGATSEGICLLEFTDRRMLDAQFAVLRRRFGCAIVPGENAHTRSVRAELQEYFRGTRREFTVPMIRPGTPFQKLVWDSLCRIPYGKTASYQDIARRIKRPRSSRAVGRANGLNRIAILIPCHRVLNRNGTLGGYGGGLWRKARLLALEQGKG